MSSVPAFTLESLQSHRKKVSPTSIIHLQKGLKVEIQKKTALKLDNLHKLATTTGGYVCTLVFEDGGLLFNALVFFLNLTSSYKRIVISGWSLTTRAERRWRLLSISITAGSAFDNRHIDSI